MKPISKTAPAGLCGSGNLLYGGHRICTASGGRLPMGYDHFSNSTQTYQGSGYNTSSLQDLLKTAVPN